MSEQELLPTQGEPIPERIPKRWPKLLICIGGTLVLLCVGLLFLLGAFMDPREKAVIDFCNDLKNTNYQAAYADHLSKSLQNDISLEKFKDSFKGFKFFCDMTDREITQSDDLFEMLAEGKVDGDSVRTLIAARKFDAEYRFDQIMIIEVSRAVYAEQMDDLTAYPGEYVFSVIFNSNVAPELGQVAPQIFIKRDGETLATAVVACTTTQGADKRQYEVYFAVPQDAVKSELVFSYWGQEVSLKDLIKAEHN